MQRVGASERDVREVVKRLALAETQCRQALGKEFEAMRAPFVKGRRQGRNGCLFRN